jgi:hypothetical protein
MACKIAAHEAQERVFEQEALQKGMEEKSREFVE